ncbi:MAG: carboxypeptidase-like regulatory domain-containing protein, partial [Planctomycetota bacterium]
PEDGVDLAQTRVILDETLATDGVEGIGASRIELRRPRADVDESGFFQLTGLRPGLFTVEATHPSYALTRLEGVSLQAGEETALDPLELQEPALLVVQLDRATDPFHGPWRVTLHDRDREALKSGEVDENGEQRHEALTPGTYSVVVLDSRGSRWSSDEIEVFPGLNTFKPETAFERFEGEVLLDGEPLVGAAVSVRQHLGNMKLERRTDEDGKFYAFLKRDLTWDIEIRRGLPRPPVVASFKKVEVPPRHPAERWPTKIFEIPDTLLTGDVFYPDGSPVEDPTVLHLKSVGLDPSLSFSELLPRGGFEKRGLAPGRYRINASFDESSTPKRGESAPVEFTLEDGSEVGPLRLQLEPQRRLEGQVLSASGEPLAGVRVIAEMRAPPGEWRSLYLPSALKA